MDEYNVEYVRWSTDWFLDYKEIQPVHPKRKSVLGVHWKDRCWSWNSNTLATSWEDLTHWKRPWCWEGLGAGGEGDDRGWDGWMASPTRWTWVWVNSGSSWWTGRPGVLRFMGSQRVRHNWVTELNWILLSVYVSQLLYPFACLWTSMLLQCTTYCKQCCNEYWGTCVSFNSSYLDVYAQPWDCWVIWQFYFQLFKEYPHCSPLFKPAF